MKLYFSEGACSRASHIALNEAGLPYTPIPMSYRKGDFDASQFLELNPMGAVPVLELDNGKVLTESTAILQYIAAQNPKANLALKIGTFEHFQFLKWMNFIATEIHKVFAPFFTIDQITKNKEAQKEILDFTTRSLNERFEILERHLTKSKYLCGDQYTVADAYLFTIMGWTNWSKVDISKYRNLNAYLARIGERPAVLKTLKLEEAANAA